MTKAPLATVAPSPAVVRPPASTAPQPVFGRISVALGLVMALVVALGLLALVLSRVALGPAATADLGTAWSRLGLLGRRLGVSRKGSDTPLDFSRRLAGRLPELGPEIMLLGAAYSRERYGAGAASADDRQRELVAWRAVRTRLLRLLALGRRGAALRPGVPAPQS